MRVRNKFILYSMIQVALVIMNEFLEEEITREAGVVMSWHYLAALAFLVYFGFWVVRCRCPHCGGLVMFRGPSPLQWSFPHDKCAECGEEI